MATIRLYFTASSRARYPVRAVGYGKTPAPLTCMAGCSIQAAELAFELILVLHAFVLPPHFFSSTHAANTYFILTLRIYRLFSDTKERIYAVVSDIARIYCAPDAGYPCAAKHAPASNTRHLRATYESYFRAFRRAWEVAAELYIRLYY